MKLICGSYSTKEGDYYLLVGGGFSFAAGAATNRTWILPYSPGDPPQLGDEWQPGPDLPWELVGGKTVPYAGTTLLVVGSADAEYAGQILKLDTDAPKWVVLSQALAEPREVYDAFLVPDDAVSCGEDDDSEATTVAK